MSNKNFTLKVFEILINLAFQIKIVSLEENIISLYIYYYYTLPNKLQYI